ncbi:hypothetical protein BAZSYMA_ACONTIG24851_2 [Bathymodiolus azoricus thioautotrophic gill symbiont]|uniref:Uncharacterized protein n=1 Tax=Bathymodiolus azoricus thioautotrophic gill symbiont TaxID=235205 RepID=A0A1H6LMD1_9GAMM|nr:hypothetical protein BAZSYMA_ACONTIG24851_2 [Bathymodiolus azoricus thioautotrophic gill symbiont]
MNSVRTLIGILYNTIINVVDIISIIPQSTNHLISTCYPIDDVVSAIANDFVIGGIARAMNIKAFQ